MGIRVVNLLRTHQLALKCVVMVCIVTASIILFTSINSNLILYFNTCYICISLRLILSYIYVL